MHIYIIRETCQTFLVKSRLIILGRSYVLYDYDANGVKLCLLNPLSLVCHPVPAARVIRRQSTRGIAKARGNRGLDTVY